jgi:acyl dehydratase
MTTPTGSPTLTCGRISRTTLALFAGASGDHNPIHIDLDVARAAGMDDVFAQGMLSMAYLARLVTEYAPQVELRSLTTRFVSMTPVHAKPTCTAVVSSVEDGVRTLDLTVALEDGTVTLTGTATLASA